MFRNVVADCWTRERMAVGIKVGQRLFRQKHPRNTRLLNDGCNGPMFPDLAKLIGEKKKSLSGLSITTFTNIHL